MKKVIAWVLVVALTAAVSIGATLAYLTDTDEDINVMTLGNVKIDQLEYERIDDETQNDSAKVQEFHDNKPLYPAVTENGFDYTPGASYVDWEQIGKENYTSPIWDPAKINNEVDKMVFVKNKGSYDAYVRSVFAFEAGKYTTLEEFNKMVHLNLNDTDWDWEWISTPVAIPNEEGGTETTNYFVAVATYNKVLTPGALTEISLSQIALDKTATNEDVEAFGETYQVLVKTQGIQADGFDDPESALDEGFGAIAFDNIPWESDAPVRGIDLRTALHYLNGDVNGTKITEKVSKVVFGLAEDHADTVAEYKPYLVDEEQDVPVSAYYVPNGTMYDIYFLASSDIYLPKDSGRLMQGMKNMTAVDTSNLNTSRAELMNHVFYQCSKLVDIDVSDFDFSSATTVKSLFNDCSSLTTLDVSDWTFPKATDMSFLFRYCKKLNGLDVSKWDISTAENISYMFFQCESLTDLDVSDFDTANATDMQFMFKNCYSLDTIDVSKWDTGNCVYFNSIFSGTNSKSMKLQGVDISNWDVSSAKNINHMFYHNIDLVSVDLSKWDVRNVESMSHMFADCNALESVDFSGWQTDSLVSLDGVFNDCSNMVTVDVSMFNTSKVREFSQMFEACSKLEKIVGLENFDTSSGQDFSEMFSGCKALKELDLSTFVTTQANIEYIALSGADNWMFRRFLSNCVSLEKLELGAGFSFDGDGTAKGEDVMAVPAAANVAGWDGYWYDADTGVAYLPADIPEETKATYVSVKPATP